MISGFGALILAVLLLLLIIVWVRAASTRREFPFTGDGLRPSDDKNLNACPPEFVSRIFGDDDIEFISRLKSSQLEKLFRQERNAVALVWVQQTSSAVRQIMRQHLETSRQSEDLEFATEASIFLQYAQLRFICAFLFALIDLVGTQRLRSLAIYTVNLTERIGETQRAFQLAAQTREISSARSS
ncbi:MAG TPA: hypothetical protein VOA64_04295 [Candidatus Dormibacteraeota bacterium]|nr:hypothetical protein [Candidatus Dormibacteraeota bacterium]